MKRILVVAGLAIAFVLGANAQRMKPWYKVSRLSVSELGVTCLNGADPTGKKFGKTLVLSCGDVPPTEITAHDIGE